MLKNWDIECGGLTDDFKDLSLDSSSNYTFNIGNKYIFKTGINFNWVNTHIELTSRLHSLGLEIPYPIRTISDTNYIIEGDRYFTLLKRVQGDLLFDTLGSKNNYYELGRDLGECIGKLHLALNTIDDVSLVSKSDFEDNVLGWALPEGKRLIDQWSLGLEDQFFINIENEVSLNSSLLPRQIIHRDPNPSNIIVRENSIVGFIDFEIAEYNVRIFDLCYMATGILSILNDTSSAIEKWSEALGGILVGYDRLCPLEEVEKSMVEVVIYSIQLIFLSYLGDKEEYSRSSKQNREMLYELWKNREWIQKAISRI